MSKEILSGAIIGAIIVCGFLLLHFWYGDTIKREKTGDKSHDPEQWW